MIDALLDKEHTPYREIGHRPVAYTLARAGIPHTTDEIRFLVAQIERLKPFPDVPDALAHLKTRYKIAVLSNGDPDTLEAAKAFHKIPFDAMISVAVANSFKPHIATYTKAAEIMGVRMDEILFVASHAFDCPRGQVRGHAFGIHRPSQAALRRHPASAGHYCAGYEEPRRSDAVKQLATAEDFRELVRLDWR